MDDLDDIVEQLSVKRAKMEEFGRNSPSFQEHAKLHSLLIGGTPLKKEQYRRHGHLHAIKKDHEGLLKMIEGAMENVLIAHELQGGMWEGEMKSARTVIEYADTFLFHVNFTQLQDEGGAIVLLQTIGKGESQTDYLRRIEGIYLAFAKRTGFEAEMLDSNGSESALRIFSAGDVVVGPFGYLKTEMGTHKQILMERGKTYTNEIGGCDPL